MTVERHFLGWDAPALPRIAAWLIERAGSARPIDLSDTVVVMPTRRAGRRLTERLAELAGDGGLLTPRVVTAGALPEELYEPEAPLAGELERTLARLHALRRAGPAEVAALLPHPPDRGDLAGGWALAVRLNRVADELAAWGLTAAEVRDRMRRGELGLDVDDTARWDVLAALDAAYEATLDARGLADRQAARRTALRGGRCRGNHHVVLAVADLNRLTVAMLERAVEAGAPVTALVHAPSEHADGFDRFGALVPTYWSAQAVPADVGELRIVDRVTDQPAAVAARLAELSEAEPIAPSRVTVGLGDEAQGEAVRRTLGLVETPARVTAGTPWSRSRPATLLAALAAFADGQRFDDFAAMLRHPDLEAWLLATLGEPTAAKIPDWIGLLDRYATDHLQATLSETWLGDPEVREPLAELYRQVRTLLPRDAGDVRPWPQWTEAIGDAVRRVYEAAAPGEEDGPTRDALLGALEALGEALGEQASLPRGEPTPAVNLAGAVRLTLAQLERAVLPPDETGEAIELVGFLELPSDGAEHVIVTSMNEGHVPSTRHADALLPDTLRKRLGMADAARQHARDLYLLRAAAGGRRTVTLLTARRDGAGDPLTPSRLLLACDADERLARIERFYGESHNHEPAPALLAPSLDPPPLTLPLTAATEHRVRDRLADLRVTDFRAYLDCPYRFYLRRIVELERVDDTARELEGRQFGDLAHDVLKAFGRHEVAGSTDPEAIRGFLHDTLDAEVRKRYGTAPRVAVRLQQQELRRRLDRFAEVHADDVRAGWRVISDYVEHQFEWRPEPGVRITGRIDRIDRNEATGACRLIDYKTGDTTKEPEQEHRKGPRDDKRWIDLQLPLYERLAREAGIVGEVELAYMAIGSKLAEIGLKRAKWSAEDLGTAIETVHEVIGSIRAGRFWPPRDPGWADEFSGLCLEGVFGRELMLEATGQAIAGGGAG